MKKGISELGIIFTLFLVLIVTLTALFMFLRNAEKLPGSVEQAAATILDGQQLATATLECRTLCNNAFDDQTSSEFCGKTISVAEVGGPAQYKYGRYAFCAEKVPCFVILGSCQDGRLTPDSCKDLLLEQDRSAYISLVKDTNSSFATFDGGCGLPVEGPQNLTNWKLRHGFTDLQSALSG